MFAAPLKLSTTPTLLTPGPLSSPGNRRSCCGTPISRAPTSAAAGDEKTPGVNTVSHAIQTLVNALALGGVYALTTLGLVIVFGIMRLINFAYAELIMAAGYALWIFTSLGVPWLAALALAIVAAT